jgi:predicted enzyme related to lactoylglutathione lyase
VHAIESNLQWFCFGCVEKCSGFGGGLASTSRGWVVYGAMFTWYELRTIDVDGAERFYREVMGWQAQPLGSGRVFLRGAERMAGLVPLSEQARSRGAPPHWLGHVALPDVAAGAQHFIAKGGELRGPLVRDERGAVAVLRDPQGAALALSSRGDGPSRAVAWHELHALDGEAAWSIYAELFGWRSTGCCDGGAELGALRTFAWNGSPHSAGAMTSAARHPHIHTHWLFHLAVDDLDRALERVVAQQGRVACGPSRFPDGGRSAVCEDFQGAAFALRETPLT